MDKAIVVMVVLDKKKTFMLSINWGLVLENTLTNKEKWLIDEAY